ncbi:MAG: redoxin domain-containing protein [Fimbriimonadaceae bacterium]|nr:redoxin domain-containing protein [Fimbriimonadaceae bacterium]
MIAATLAMVLLAPPPTIKLVDGESFALTGRKATVVVFMSHDCPIANDSQPALKNIYEKYKSKNVGFVGVYIDPKVSLETVKKHKADFGFSYSQAIDSKHTVVKLLGAKVTPEAFVLNSRGEVQYRGRINNAYSDLGVRRTKITENNLDDAVSAVLAGKKPNPSRTKSHGCLIPSLADFGG